MISLYRENVVTKGMVERFGSVALNAVPDIRDQGTGTGERALNAVPDIRVTGTGEEVGLNAVPDIHNRGTGTGEFLPDIRDRDMDKRLLNALPDIRSRGMGDEGPYTGEGEGESFLAWMGFNSNHHSHVDKNNSNSNSSYNSNDNDDYNDYNDKYNNDNNNNKYNNDNKNKNNNNHNDTNNIHKFQPKISLIQLCKSDKKYIFSILPLLCAMTGIQLSSQCKKQLNDFKDVLNLPQKPWGIPLGSPPSFEFVITDIEVCRCMLYVFR